MSNDNVEIVEENNVVQIVDQRPTVIVTAPGPQGPQGPPGPEGPPGPGGEKIRYLYSQITSHYYVDLDTDTFIEVDASVDPLLITLPLATNSNKGWGVYISKGVPTSFVVKVQTQGGQLIDDESEFILDDYQVQLFISKGDGWKPS